ncbi:hypothetical protein WR25_06696 [Diploscapter pachys]|uniref:Uncharacterized protein n=1 Tax=Diploscapter pachys TaxID=2018661 RepID=A0A2A2K0R0_9BILA|nr:hypothetical protein WR25_06696 [Diploscapter pachys]
MRTRKPGINQGLIRSIVNNDELRNPSGSLQVVEFLSDNTGHGPAFCPAHHLRRYDGVHIDTHNHVHIDTHNHVHIDTHNHVHIDVHNNNDNNNINYYNNQMCPISRSNS